MKINRFFLFRYDIRLKSPLKLGPATFESRRGLVIKIEGQNHEIGFGDIAPMPGFSRESAEDAEAQAKSFIANLPGEFSNEITEKSLDGLLPSVRFGIECAMLDAIARDRKTNVAGILSKSPRSSVSINGLLAGDSKTILAKASEYANAGYSTVKLKVGSPDVETDIDLTKQVKKVLWKNMNLRLDANRSWDIRSARKFCEGVSDCKIEYLEEPLSSIKDLEIELKNHSFAVPIALDETTREILPFGLTNYQGLKAVVLKPTMLGIKRTLEYVSKAKEMNVNTIIGSSFESSLGLSFLAQMAAAINKDDIAAGLDTYSWFADDIIEGSLPVRRGKIELADLQDTETVLESRLLKLVQ